MSTLEAPALQAALRAAQNPDGGWGAVPGRASDTESTCFALVALRASSAAATRASHRAGLAWLLARQDEDGGWPLPPGGEEPSWVTSLAMLALDDAGEGEAGVLRGARWLLNEEGRRFGWLQRIVFALVPEDRRMKLDPDLVGWPWRSGSFAWVEPTAFALLALKKLRSRLDTPEVERRIRQGERLLFDRACAGGGWNYGNSRVLGEELWPYPEVTAVALIALQDRAEAPATREALAALPEMLDEHASGLSLGWAMLCLAVHGRDPAPFAPRLARRHAESGFLRETRSTALALLALEGATDWLRV